MRCDNITYSRKYKKININSKLIALIIIFITIIIFNIGFYYFDKIIEGTLLGRADAEARARTSEIINSVVLEEFSKDFKYDDIITVEKDKEGNIIMIRADTIKMNKIASETAIKAQKSIRESMHFKVKLPLSYIMKSNILSSYGPDIGVKIEPSGFIETKYISNFESTGINQTRHKIYIQVKTNIRIFVPLKSKDSEITNEIPVAETIIVGKVPESMANLNLNGAGIKLDNTTSK